MNRVINEKFSLERREGAKVSSINLNIYICNIPNHYWFHKNREIQPSTAKNTLDN